MQEAKRNNARISNIANQIVASVNKAHATEVSITWYENKIYCRISGKKAQKEEQYSEIGRKTLDAIFKRLREIGYNKPKKEVLELNAVRYVFQK